MQLKEINDPILQKLILEFPKPELSSTNSVFHDLMSCIIEQQIHYRSTKKIFQRMLDGCNINRLDLTNFSLFEENAISKLKLSMGKLETISRVVDFWRNNTIDWQNLSDEEIRTKLKAIKGIGDWTIDMILLYTLNRPTIFPVDDFHLKQIMISLYNLNPTVKLKSQMLEIAAQWGNEKSLATLYLLEYKKQYKISKASF
jgi:DNA-3-methyladenine glycosylase II